MEASRRERIFLYAVVPVACTILGAVATVVASKLFGSDPPAQSIIAIVQATNITPADKMKLIELANKNDQQFYDFLRTFLLLMVVPLGAIAYALADRIRSR